MGIAPGHQIFLHILVDVLLIHRILQKNQVAQQILALTCPIGHASVFRVQYLQSPRATKFFCRFQ